MGIYKSESRPDEGVTLTRKREKLQAYFAGLFDGEGCVHINRQLRAVDAERGWNPTYTAYVTVSMSDPAPLGLLQREYGGTLRTVNHFTGNVRKDGTPRKQMYCWTVAASDARRFLEEIKEYVIVKHEEVKVALSFDAHVSRYRAQRGFNFSSKPLSYFQRSEELYQKCSQLKRISKGVNSVDALMGHGLRQYRSKPEHVEADVLHIRSVLEGVETTAESSATR